MMKFVFLFLVSLSAFADSNDFGSSDKGATLTPKDIKERLEVIGEIFISSPDGERLIYQAGEMRTWRFGGDLKEILSNWHYEHPDGSVKVALRHRWTVDDQGKLRVHIEQFDSMPGAAPQTFENDAKLGKTVRDETITVKDLAPISWIVDTNSERRVTARFTPFLRPGRRFIDAAIIPVAIENGVLTDSKNRVWAQDLAGINHKYVSLKTYLGTVVMSYYPFKGAEEIGHAEGHEIHVKQHGLALRINSSNPVVLGDGRLRVYGWINPDEKAKRYGSIHMLLGDDDKDLKDFKKQ